jgi:hypothetical protein
MKNPAGNNVQSHCYFKKQPETGVEVDFAIKAVEANCCGSFRYAGSDRECHQESYVAQIATKQSISWPNNLSLRTQTNRKSRTRGSVSLPYGRLRCPLGAGLAIPSKQQFWPIRRKRPSVAGFRGFFLDTNTQPLLYEMPLDLGLIRLEGDRSRSPGPFRKSSNGRKSVLAQFRP